MPQSEDTWISRSDHKGRTTQSPRSDRIVIIGGGIAGLACGCYLQMNGFETEILEAGTALGGLCAAWNRGPYIFDGCLHWLLGTQPSLPFHRMWSELGVTTSRKFVSYDEIVRIEGRQGEVLSVPADLDKLAREFKRVAPEDTALIDQLVRAARRSALLRPPEQPLELMTPFERLKTGLSYLPILPVVARWKNVPVSTYLARYRNPFLREALMAVAGDARVSALALVMLLAFRCGNNTGFVVGGSRAFAQSLADRYANLGGRVRLNARVASILVENGKATGVRCTDQNLVPAAAVVSCADRHTTIFQMLDRCYVDKKTLYLDQNCAVFPALVQVSLGIGATFPEAPHTLVLLFARPLVVDDKNQHNRLDATVFRADSALCPEGKMVVTVRLTADCKFWSSLRESDLDGYNAKKQCILQEVVAILDGRFPGLARHVETTDVATPATFVRHTGNWQGSYQGWLPTPRILGRPFQFVLPGLKDFYMAGHWVALGGGLPLAALSGRYVAQMICARDGKTFAAAAA
jgi:phytoene dehydrogenase-like protein